MPESKIVDPEYGDGEEKTKEKNKGGRPLKFETVEELQEKIDAFFVGCDKGELIEVYDKKKQEVRTIVQRDPYTITGLALALDTSRQVLCDYGERDKFADTILRAKLKCENYVEKYSLRGDVPPAIGVFVLKNYDWRDKTEVENTGEHRMLIINRHKKREENDD